MKMQLQDGKGYFLTGNKKAIYKTIDIDLDNASDDELQRGLKELCELWISPVDSKHKARKPEINRVVSTFEKAKSAHAHMLIASRNTISGDRVMEIFGSKGWHVEPIKDFDKVLSYVWKSGEFSDKEHMRLTEPYDWGEYSPHKAKADGSASKLYKVLESYVSDGMTPSQIYLADSRLAMHSKAVEAYYSAFIQKSIKPERELHVHYRFGASGTGKTYGYIEWCEEVGSEHVYFASCTSKNVWDGFEEGVHTHCVLDELRADTFSLPTLLQLTDRYPVRLGARYRDRQATYENLLITSPLSPEALFAEMKKSKDAAETLTQFMRRLETISYCFIDPSMNGKGRYRMITVSPSDYKGADDLLKRSKRILEESKSALGGVK